MRALITGCLGQDGLFLAELLKSKGYLVAGLTRGTSTTHPRFPEWSGDSLYQANILDMSSLQRTLDEVRPDEIYHLAAESHVGRSFKEPHHSFDVITRGTLNVLEAVRHSDYRSKVYLASSSEMFGGQSEQACTELTSFAPRSPYACAKLAAHTLGQTYRTAYNMFVCCGILFNHESERRGPEFVTRKITMGLARIAAGDPTPIRLGNLKARRDWGYAKDYVLGMWLMLQHNRPDDYVLATGETRSIQDFLDAAWEPPNSHLVEIDPAFFRPAEVNVLIGDASKARDILGWQPTTSFRDMGHRMVQHDRRLSEAKGLVNGQGYQAHG